MSEVTKMHWTIKVKFYSAIWIQLMQWFPGHWPSLRCIMMISPPSLSTPSPHWVSSLVAQSAPSQPRSHSQRQSPDKAPAPGREKWPVVHRPWSEHIRGQPWMVQWRPFQPVTHRHVPFLHWPCSSHLQRISSWSLAWIIFQTQTSGRSPCSDTGSLTSPADTRTWEDGHQVSDVSHAHLTSCSRTGRGRRTPGRTASHCSLRRSSPGHTRSAVTSGRGCRDLHTRGHMTSRRGQPGHSLRPASPSCRHRRPGCSSRVRCSSGQDSQDLCRTRPCSPSCRHTCRPRSDRVRCSLAPRTPRTWHTRVT